MLNIKKEPYLNISIFFISFILTAIVVFSQLKNFPTFKSYADSQSYILMAEGKLKGIPYYHIRRILHPYLVSRIRSFWGTDVSFLFIGILSIFIFIFIILRQLCYILKDKIIYCITLGFLPFIVYDFKCLYNPHLIFITLIGIYLMLIYREKYMLSIIFLFLLFLTRDEAFFIMISFILSLLIKFYKEKNNYSYYAVLIFMAILTFLVSSLILMNVMKYGQNIHNLSYLYAGIIRIPLFFLRNFFGIRHWVDTYKELSFYTHPPLFYIDAPVWLKMHSRISTIGIYEFSFSDILQNWLFIFSSLGIAPFFVYYLFKKRYFNALDNSVLFNICLFFGSISFLFATVSGPPDMRYYSHAWPLILVMGYFLKKIFFENRVIIRKIIFIHILSSWIAYLFMDNISIFNLFLLVIYEIVLYLYTWYILNSFHKKYYVMKML